MPIYDKRLKNFVFEGGTDLLEVYLEAAEYIVGSLAGWFTIGYMAGGTVGPERDVEEIKSEAGVKIRDRVTNDKYVFANASLQTDDDTLAVFEFLEDNAKKYRYKLPAFTSGGAAAFQIFGLYNGLIRKENYTLETGEGALHQRDFTVDGTVNDDGDLKEIATVTDIVDETGWPTVLRPFRTDITKWPT